MDYIVFLWLLFYVKYILIVMFWCKISRTLYVFKGFILYVVWMCTTAFDG